MKFLQNNIHNQLQNLKDAHIVPTERKTINAFLLSYPYIVPNGTNYWIKYLLYTPLQSPFSILGYTGFVAFREQGNLVCTHQILKGE
jgi:hypothetical protein